MALIPMNDLLAIGTVAKWRHMVKEQPPKKWILRTVEILAQGIF